MKKPVEAYATAYALVACPEQKGLGHYSRGVAPQAVPSLPPPVRVGRSRLEKVWRQGATERVAISGASSVLWPMMSVYFGLTIRKKGISWPSRISDSLPC